MGLMPSVVRDLATDSLKLSPKMKYGVLPYIEESFVVLEIDILRKWGTEGSSGKTKKMNLRIRGREMVSADGRS